MGDLDGDKFDKKLNEEMYGGQGPQLKESVQKKEHKVYNPSPKSESDIDNSKIREFQKLLSGEDETNPQAPVSQPITKPPLQILQRKPNQQASVVEPQPS